MEPAKAVTQRAIASGTGVDEGHTSRIVGKLLDAGLVERGEGGTRGTDPETLLSFRLARSHRSSRSPIRRANRDRISRNAKPPPA